MSQDDDSAAIRKALNEVFSARTCMKRSGSNYEQFHRDLINSHVSKSREHPHDISEVHRQMEQFKMVLAQKNKIDQIKGSQHIKTDNEYKSNEFQGEQHLRDRVNKYPGFKYDCLSPDCHGARNYKFTIKAYESAINFQEIIDQKLKYLKESKKSTRSNGTDSGIQHMDEAEIIQDPHETD